MTGSLPSRVLIVQPYIPSYRVPLFRKMKERLADEGLELHIAAARPHGEDAARQDDEAELLGTFPLPDTVVRLVGRDVHMRRLGSVLTNVRPEFVIIEQAIKNMETYSLLLRSALRRDLNVAMWGQGRSFSTEQSQLEHRLKLWLTRQSDWFFAYTQEGADVVASSGFPERRITVLRNSIDDQSLRADLERVTDADLRDYCSELGLTEGRTALFLGGVDKRKSIDLLLAAAEEVAERVPGFTLLVGGAGDLSERVATVQRAGGPVRLLGRVSGVDKARALRAASVLMIPSWVGLVAVDSLVSGCPIVTTDDSSHSPEFAYLTDGRNAVVSEASVAAYSSAVAGLLEDPTRLAALRTQAATDASAVTLDGMVDRFCTGIVSWRASRAVAPGLG